MSKIVTGGHQVKLATDVCIDYSIGKKVFAYLEKTLTDENEISTFVEHAGGCSFCMQTIVKWHYDDIVDEMNKKAAKTNLKSFSMAKIRSMEPAAGQADKETKDDPVSGPTGIDKKIKINTRSH